MGKNKNLTRKVSAGYQKLNKPIVTIKHKSVLLTALNKLK